MTKDNPNICVVCELPIEGKHYGMGDGTGQKFAHDACYWRRKTEEYEQELINICRIIDPDEPTPPACGRSELLVRNLKTALRNQIFMTRDLAKMLYDLLNTVKK